MVAEDGGHRGDGSRADEGTTVATDRPRGDARDAPDAPDAPGSESGDPHASVPPPTARSVGFTVSSLGFAVSHRFTQTLAPLGLEPKEFALMRTVGAAEGRTQQAIAAGLQIPASRMVALVDALEARGLVERRHNPRDRRARELYLTPSGAELLARAFTLAAALEQEICAEMSAQERERLLELLGRVGAALDVPPGVHAAARTHADSPS